MPSWWPRPTSCTARACSDHGRGSTAAATQTVCRAMTIFRQNKDDEATAAQTPARTGRMRAPNRPFYNAPAPVLQCETCAGATACGPGLYGSEAALRNKPTKVSARQTGGAGPQQCCSWPRSGEGMWRAGCRPTRGRWCRCRSGPGLGRATGPRRPEPTALSRAAKAQGCRRGRPNGA